jgi:hypothetical protein
MSNGKNKNAKAKEGSPPVARVRLGLITASIFERSTDSGIFHSVAFERRYQDAEGNWKSSHSYDAADLLKLSKLADMAHTRIREIQAEVSS